MRVRAGGARDPVLLVHGDRVVLVLLPHRRNRLLRVLHLRAQDLLGRQDRLAPCHGRWRRWRCSAGRWCGHTLNPHTTRRPAGAAARARDCRAGGVAGDARGACSAGRAAARVGRCMRTCGGRTQWGCGRMVSAVSPAEPRDGTGCGFRADAACARLGAPGGALAGCVVRNRLARFEQLPQRLRAAPQASHVRRPVCHVRWLWRLPGCSCRSRARKKQAGERQRRLLRA